MLKNLQIGLKSSFFQNEKKLVRLFLICLSLALFNQVFLSYIANNYFPKYGSNPLDKYGPVFQFIMACLVAPIVETLIFQYLPYQIFEKLKVTNSIVRIVIPSLIFAFDHNFNPIYMLAAFNMGLIMNYLFLWCKANNKNAIYTVALLHFLINLLAVIT